MDTLLFGNAGKTFNGLKIYCISHIEQAIIGYLPHIVFLCFSKQHKLTH